MRARGGEHVSAYVYTLETQQQQALYPISKVRAGALYCGGAETVALLAVLTNGPPAHIACRTYMPYAVCVHYS